MALGTEAVSPLLGARDERGAARIALAVLLAGALVLRLVPVVISPSLNWADEVFQTTEQAHRLVYGTGLVPWEFEFGIRSWLLPGAIAALMEAARLIGEGPDFYLPVIGTAFAALSLLPVVCVFLWCRRRFGVSGALVGGLAMAVAPELVYFGGRTLAEVVAGNLLLPALYLLEAPSSRRRAVVAGLLFALVLVLRVQLAPALALIAIWTLWAQPPARARIWAVIGGAAIALGLAGALDAATLGYPFASLWRYFDYNLFYGVSSLFGISPWYYYLAYELGIWQGALFGLVALALVGSIRRPLWLAAAVLIVAAHSAIPHKEYRFIYPAVVLIAALAAIGLAQLVAWARQRFEPPLAGPLLAVLTAAYWCFIAGLAWTGDGMRLLRDLKHDNLAAASHVAHLSGVCGIGLYGLDGYDWVSSGGYTYFHQPVPIYWPKDGAEFKATAGSFDILVATKPPPAELAQDFRPEQCFGSVCVTRRVGSCAAKAMMSMPVPEPLQGLAAAAGR